MGECAASNLSSFSSATASALYPLARTWATSLSSASEDWLSAAVASVGGVRYLGDLCDVVVVDGVGKFHNCAPVVREETAGRATRSGESKRRRARHLAITAFPVGSHDETTTQAKAIFRPEQDVEETAASPGNVLLRLNLPRGPLDVSDEGLDDDAALALLDQPTASGAAAPI